MTRHRVWQLEEALYTRRSEVNRILSRPCECGYQAICAASNAVEMWCIDWAEACEGLLGVT